MPATPAVDDLGWLNDAVLGAHLPIAAQAALERAGAAWHDDVEAEHWLDLATACAPEHPAVFVARYRFYFYKHRLAKARAVAERCLEQTARRMSIPVDWRELGACPEVFPQAAANDYTALPRFYLFTLKALAYLHMRLGEFVPATDMLGVISLLDPLDRLGARLLVEVLARHERGDDEDA